LFLFFPTGIGPLDAGCSSPVAIMYHMKKRIARVKKTFFISFFWESPLSNKNAPKVVTFLSFRKKSELFDPGTFLGFFRPTSPREAGPWKQNLPK
jgi:hypothetical protein